MSRLRVLLADDHTLLRAGLRSILGDLPDVEVVGEAAAGPEALEMIRDRQPDVALLDIAMPGLSGLEVAAQLAAEGPPTRVVILSMHADQEYVRQAMSAGAVGYLLKDSGTSELEQALKAVARGVTFLSPAISNLLMADYRRLASGSSTAPPPVASLVPESNPLTPRQREVLRLIAEGRNTKAIGRALGISIKTVETHRTQLMERLGIHDVAGLVRYALRIGLIPSHD